MIYKVVQYGVPQSGKPWDGATGHYLFTTATTETKDDYYKILTMAPSMRSNPYVTEGWLNSYVGHLNSFRLEFKYD